MSNFNIGKLFEKFEKRPVYKELSVEILAAIPNDKLEQAIIDYVVLKLTSSRKNLLEVSNMSEGFQIVCSTWVLESEVSHGGFKQFFTNAPGKFIEMVLQSLKKLDAIHYYEILEKGIAIHAEIKENRSLKKLFSGEPFRAFVAAYRFSAYKKCDNEFRELGSSLSKLRVQYIRTHADEFVGN